jgi:putative membrane protein
MHFISEQDQQRISEAISSVEAKTSGEIVTVIAQSSDDYQYIPLLWAALLALAVPGLFLFAEIDWFLEYFYVNQLAIFVVSAIIFRFPPVRLWLIPKVVRQRRAHRYAMEQFVLNNLPATKQSNGILLFVSVAEHYVEIIADKGINDLVPDDAWDRIVKDFTELVKKGAIAEGFITAIQECGKHLQQHFPDDKVGRNDLPDHLIIV